MGKNEMGVGVLGHPLPDRVIGPTSAQRVGGLGRKEDAKRARQRPPCTCAGRSWWVLTTHRPQRCPATVATYLGPWTQRSRSRRRQGREGSVEGKSPRKKHPSLRPNIPQHRSSPARRRTRPKPAARPEPNLAAQPRSKAGEQAPPTCLCLCLAVTSCPAIRRSLVVERCAIYTSPGSRRPRTSEWPRLGIRAHPKVGSQYRGHPLAEAPISATPRLPEIGLGGSAFALAGPPTRRSRHCHGDRRTVCSRAVAMDDGVWSRGAHVHPVHETR